MKITFYGHTCFEASVGETKVLFDPFIKPNPAAAHIDVATLNPTIIAISHGHGDHLADAAEIADQSGATVIANYEVATWLGKQGVKNTVGMNIGGKFTSGNVSLSLTQALHSSSMPDGSYGGNPNGFVLKIEGETAYYAGDTDAFGDMKLIAEFYKPSFAFLPIGDMFTMGIDRAAWAAEMMGLKKVIGMHFDTFPPITIDHAAAKAHFASKGIELILMKIGESIEM
jgi:L-ascorbate metabolism protein UlaG (beta-lactamase superfamily)